MDEEIEELKEKMNKIKEEIKEKIREKTIKNNGSNILRRMSVKFFKEYCKINEKREENGFEKLGLPEYTLLIIRHKDWRLIKNDIIFYNKDIESNGGISNE